MLRPEIEKKIRTNEKYAKMLEDYDRTGVFPLEKIRKNFTIKMSAAAKLKKASIRTGKNMSEIIDELIAKELPD